MTTQSWLVVIAMVLYVLWRGYRLLYRYPYQLCTYPGIDGGRLKSKNRVPATDGVRAVPALQRSPWFSRGIGGS
ncbi:MAG: hypothetical protein ACRDTE_29405 [Pseudonocardiaceae bacterium]